MVLQGEKSVRIWDRGVKIKGQVLVRGVGEGGLWVGWKTCCFRDEVAHGVDTRDKVATPCGDRSKACQTRVPRIPRAQARKKEFNTYQIMELLLFEGLKTKGQVAINECW